MRAVDLLDWHPRTERPADARQGELFHDTAGDPLPAATMPEWIPRAELEARRTRGLRRRLRWVLRRNR